MTLHAPRTVGRRPEPAIPATGDRVLAAHGVRPLTSEGSRPTSGVYSTTGGG